MTNDVLRRHATLVRRGWIATEMLVTWAAFLSAYRLRHDSGLLGSGPLYPLDAYWPVAAAAVLLWAVSLYATRMYHAQRLSTILQTWFRLALAGLSVALFLGLGLFLARADWVSRGLIVGFLGISYLMLGLERTLMLLLMHATRRRGQNLRYVIAAGEPAAALRLQDSFESNPQWGLSLLGRVSIGEPSPENPSSLPTLGHVRDLPRLLETNVIDEIIVDLPPSELGYLDEIIAAAELRGVNVRLMADLVDLKIARTEVGEFDGRPVLTFTTLPKRAGELLAKRAMDIGIVVATAPVTLPILITLMAGLRLTGTHSPLFRQIRVGRNGRHFTMFKLRTMRSDEEFDPERLKALNRVSGPAFKADPDPRVTPLGRFLRRWSLDELPQLLNVLRGEMSLVGPRPPLPGEVERYEPWQRRRLSMRPGMTGLWQVSGRAEPDFGDWVRLDLEYIDQWSIRKDLWILSRTIPAVLSGKGAL